MNMIAVRRLLADEEEKVTVEAPLEIATISVPNTIPQDALLSRIERIEQAILTAGREQVQAILKVSQMQLETVQAAVSMNAEAHADTQKLVHDLWECETVFLKQLDKMIRERVIPVPTGQKK